MNKSKIVRRVAEWMALTKRRAEGAVEVVLEAIAEALANDDAVRIAGFGASTTKKGAARTGRNRRTGESAAIPASRCLRSGRGSS